jgi:ankyrin repeat protein
LYNINLVQQQGYNVVIGACMIGNSDPDILKMVIEAGANVNHLDPKGGSAVFLCAQHNRPDFMRILFKYGALPAPKPPTGHDDTMERNSAPIHIAASRNNVGALRVLLEHGAEANQKILSTGATALILSAHSGFVESIQVLIEFDAELDEKDLEGRTALHKCCEHGHLKAAEVLIQSSALVDCIDNKGYTPLMIAVRCGYLALIKVLLAAGANASHTSNRGSSMFDKLFEAIGSGVDLETALEIGELLIKHGANVNGSKSSNHTPLHTACALQNVDVCCGMLKLLLKNGANVNGVDSSGKTALYIAAREGAIEVVTILLNHGAHVESLDAFGSSPLIDCCLSNSSLGKPHIEIAELLISRGADMNLVNSDGLSPLAAAMSSGNFKMITYLVSFTICDLSVLTVCKASRSIMVSSEEKDAIHSAIDAGLRKRSELYFMASVNPRFGRQSILYKHLLKKSMFDRNLLGLMYSFVQYDESVEDESFNDEPLDAA